LTTEGLLSIVGSFIIREENTVAKANPDPKTSKAKRRLRATPTLREQVEKGAEPEKPTKRGRVSKVLFTPLRFLGRLLTKLGGGIRKSGFGRLVGKTYKSRVFKPVRFIVKVLRKVLFIDYFKGSWQELRLVTWPDSRTTWRLTFAVLGFAIIFGLVVAGVDYVFEKLFREVILKA
jgi:preprotein translocase SecE subunit